MSGLKERVDQFACMELPGQPQMMHMGTSYLVNDLWREVQQLRAALEPFANYADSNQKLPPDFRITQGSYMARRQLTMGDCYDARKALANKGGYHEDTIQSKEASSCAGSDPAAGGQ